MVELGVGAAVGEEVGSDIIRHYRGLTDDALVRIRASGISDQRRALISNIFAERTGLQRRASEKELLTRFAEPKRVIKPVLEVAKKAKFIYSPTGRIIGISDPVQRMTIPIRFAEVKAGRKAEKVFVGELKRLGITGQRIERVGIPGQTLAGRAVERAVSRIGKPIKAGIKIIGDIEKSKVFQERAKGLDIITGGVITERRLGREQEELNKEIEKFNKKYGGKELNEEAYKKAVNELKELTEKEDKIKKEGEELEERTSRKIIKSLSMEKLKKRDLEKFPLTESEKKAIKVTEDILKTDKKRLKEFEKKPGVLAMVERTRLKLSISNYEDQLNTFKKGGQILATGTVPIIPAGGLPSMTKVLFLGTQKVKKGKIITDIVFKTGKKWGIARAVTVAKDTGGVTVTAGKLAKIGKIFKTKKQAFRAIEVFATKKIGFKGQELIQLTKRSKDYLIVKRNLTALTQIGLGKIQTVKGTKFIRPVVDVLTGKLVAAKAKVATDTFASLARIVTKGTWSKIIGKTITLKGDKVRFLGLIKGITKPGVKFFRLTTIQKQQYATALKQISSAVAAATAKADKIKGLTNIQKLAVTANILSISKVVPPKVEPKVVVKVEPLPPVRIVTKTSITREVKQISRQQQRGRQSTKQQLKQLSKQQQKANQQLKQLDEQQQRARQRGLQLTKQQQRQQQKARQRVKQLTKQQQIVKQGLKLKLKTLTVQKQALIKLVPGTPITPKTIPASIRRLIIPIKKRIKVKRIIKPIKKISYDVFARPLKKTKKGKKPKLIKVNKVPLTKKRAEDLRNYIADTSLARTASIKAVKGKPKKPRLKAPIAYSSKTRKKFRRYKIVKGRKKMLPKGKVIEKRKHLLDTKQEKRGITLRRRIAQLQKQARRKTPKKSKVSALRKPMRRSLRKRKHSTSRKPIRKSLTISRMKSKMPLRLKKFKRELIKEAPKGKKPTRWRFKGDRRLGFRNNKVVEIVKFTPKKSTTSSKRKATPAQLKALAKGRKILEERRKGR